MYSSYETQNQLQSTAFLCDVQLGTFNVSVGIFSSFGLACLHLGEVKFSYFIVSTVNHVFSLFSVKQIYSLEINQLWLCILNLSLKRSYKNKRTFHILQ